MKLDYFYSAQTERFIKHLIRMFGGFKVMTPGNDGVPVLRRVPCRYGDISRQAATVLHENSENALPSAPFMTVNIKSMNISRANVRAPMFEQTAVGINKKDADGKYVEELDGYVEVERFNPVPWDIEFTVDIWTTNSANKFELFEQISTVFAPSCPLQLSTNPYDWSSSSHVELTGYDHAPRGQQSASDVTLNISQFSFKTMIWYSLPAKVNRAHLISQIVTNIKETRLDDFNIPSLSNWQNVAQDVYTPGNHMIGLELVNMQNNVAIYKAKLLSKLGNEKIQGQMLDWTKLFKYYSNNFENVSIRLLNQVEGDNSPVVGTVVAGDIPNEALVTLDTSTITPTTADPIQGFVDPNKLDMQAIVNAGVAVRYVVHESISDSAYPAGSIITFDSSGKRFDFVIPVEDTVLVNLKDNIRYKYDIDLGWHEVILQKYQPGYWRLGFSE